MAGAVGSFSLWGRAIFFGFLVLLNILKRVITKGPGKILHWKQWNRPRYLDDPSLGTHGILTLKDVKIHYVASGPEDKPLMLFVHGFPEFWYSWRHQIREFQKDYRVVAIDQRGYSESSKPPGIHNYSVGKLASDLEQIIQALGYKSCVLVAHDWGGLVAWAFARSHSHLVDKIIVLNAPPFPIYQQVVQTNKQQARKSWYVFFFQLPFLPELSFKLQDFAVLDSLLPSKYTKDSSGDADKSREENIAPYKYTFSQPGALTPPMNYYRNVMSGQPGNDLANHDLKYTMPSLLIWGCKDAALDEAIPDTIEKEAPSIEVRRIPEANHFVQIDAPEDVNKIMREWLDKH